MRGSFAGRSARPTGSVKSADPAKSAEPVDPSKQVRIGKTDGELVIRPSGPSTGTIVLGVFFCLIGLMSMLCLLPIGAWRWMPNPSTLFFYVVGGLGALLLIISVVWAGRRRGASAPTGTPVSRTVPRKASSANCSAADTTTHVATMTWPDPMHAFPSFPISHRASGCGIVAIIHIRIVIYACNRAIPSMTTARVHDDFRQQPGERDKAQPCEHDDGMPVLGKHRRIVGQRDRINDDGDQIRQEHAGRADGKEGVERQCDAHADRESMVGYCDWTCRIRLCGRTCRCGRIR